ncbi:MAG TPA: tyrosine/phenylalanine carboxypeptidase domain-containing protein [Allosphingosinicella sp.]|nr:tyrosine/phenylalanine carboxypeptidase domain-containing protein [Allosphingosinicella sp.]
MKSTAIQAAPEAFAPEFGPRGELRQTIGRSGRAHLDRWLPFLVLHRSDDPANSIARRVAVNSPGYLIWSPEEDEEAAAALRAIAAALRDRLGPVLLIDVEDAPWQEQAEDAPELPPFVVRVGAAGGEAALRALDALSEACGEVEVDLRRATVDAAAPAEPEPVLSGVEGAGDADRLRMTIPPIHRGPDGRPYPRLTHDLAVALGDAVLRAACAYTEGGPAAPLHYRALGRSAFLAAALHADRKLDAIARSYDFLLSLTPINAAEAMHAFLEGQAERAPQFRYRPLTVDPDVAKRDLYGIDLTLLEDPTLERLLCAKRRELDYQLTMLATRNTPGFRPASQLLYGAVDSELLGDAHAILAVSRRRAPPRGESVGAMEIADAARALVERYRRADGRFDATVEVRDDVSGLLVSGHKLMIASDSRVARGRVDPLLAHEISVHLLTCCNGAAQGLSIFRSGLAHYEGIQEGLGVFAEWAVGGLTRQRLRLLAGRVVAVDAMLGGADFIETWRGLSRDHGFTGPTAFNVAMRVFRSGGFAKDAIYLKGFRQVVDLVVAGASLDPFWLGKIAPEDVEAIEELLLRGLLRPPVFRPEFLDRPDARRRIALLRAGLPFDRLIELE